MRKLDRHALLLGLAVAAMPGISAASVFGSLGNFDVVNDTGSTAHGFEIELEDLHVGDISEVFGGPGRGFPTGRGFDPATSVSSAMALPSWPNTAMARPLACASLTWDCSMARSGTLVHRVVAS